MNNHYFAKLLRRRIPPRKNTRPSINLIIIQLQTSYKLTELSRHESLKLLHLHFSVFSMSGVPIIPAPIAMGGEKDWCPIKVIGPCIAAPIVVVMAVCSFFSMFVLLLYCDPERAIA